MKKRSAVVWKTEMRACIVYSSRTGNTRSVGEHLASVFSLPLFSVDEPPLFERYDSVILGFWTWRGGPDEAMTGLMRSLRGKDVFFFGTMTAYPDSEHARRCASRACTLLEEGGCRVIGHFFCQGRLDPQVLARSSHPRTPERISRIQAAALHPDGKDFLLAEECVRAAFSL